jgi:transglutaminase-like putative cysteine protease
MCVPRSRKEVVGPETRAQKQLRLTGATPWVIRNSPRIPKCSCSSASNPALLDGRFPDAGRSLPQAVYQPSLLLVNGSPICREEAIHFPHPRIKPILLSFVLASTAVGICAPTFASDASKPVQAKQAVFQVKNEFKVQVPKGAKTVRMWFAVPQEDSASVIRDFNVATDFPVHYFRDDWGNCVGYVEVITPAEDSITLREEFGLTRTEIRNNIDPAKTRPMTEQERAALYAYLQPSSHVIVNDQIKSLSTSIVAGETNPILAARKIYDWTLQNVDYWVKDPDRLKASPVGSTEYCLTKKTGNCTDFHSLFASLAIASGIPTRMIYGSLLKPTLNGMQIDGSYHCWIQFFAPEYGWLPLDVSLANIYGKEFPLTEKNKKLVELTTATGYKGLDASKVDYYFGNLDERRVTWSMGRDLILQPPQDDGPVNALVKIYVEVDGKQSTNWTREFTYAEVTK